MIPQKDEAVLANNPIGFYIVEFSMSRDTVGESNKQQQNQNKQNAAAAQQNQNAR